MGVELEAGPVGDAVVAEQAVAVALWPRYFGRLHIGSIQGTGQMIGVVGASLGPLPVGLAFDLAGSATLTIRLLALFPIAAAILALLFLRTSPAVTGYAHLE